MEITKFFNVSTRNEYRFVDLCGNSEGLQSNGAASDYDVSPRVNGDAIDSASIRYKLREGRQSCMLIMPRLMSMVLSLNHLSRTLMLPDIRCCQRAEKCRIETLESIPDGMTEPENPRPPLCSSPQLAW